MVRVFKSLEPVKRCASSFPCIELEKNKTEAHSLVISMDCFVRPIALGPAPDHNQVSQSTLPGISKKRYLVLPVM
jgi:hypothetical protein